MKLYIIALAKISPNFHHFFGQNFIFSKNHKELLKVAKFAKKINQSAHPECQTTWLSCQLSRIKIVLTDEGDMQDVKQGRRNVVFSQGGA